MDEQRLAPTYRQPHPTFRCHHRKHPCSRKKRRSTSTSNHFTRLFFICWKDSHRPRVPRCIERRCYYGPMQKRWLCERSEEHTSELQSRENHVCRLLL